MPVSPALNFPRKSLLLTAASIALACPAMLAQNTPAATSPAASATPAPSFDVATIKPHPDMLTMTGVMNTADGVNGAAATLSMLVQYAYGLRSEDQVSGGPDWAKTDRFDVQAKIGEADIAAMEKLNPADKKARRELMMQALLSERFQLRVHSETKQAPVYDLVVAKGGSKLKDAATDSSDHLRMGPDGKPLTGFMQFLKETSTAQGYSMDALAALLSEPFARVGRPVLNKTGLTGSYNFTLDWSPQMAAVLPGAAANPASSDDTTSIFTALGDLGLKLQPATGPIDTIVIDHVERPTAD